MTDADHSTATDDKPDLRVFIAVELPREIKESAARPAARLRGEFPRARASWERPEKIHITLKFIGDVAAARVENLARAAARAASQSRPFEIAVAGAGVFPPKGLARVLWLGVEDAGGGLALLWRRLEDECAAEGFGRERRALHPHVTVARLRTPEGARELAERHRRAAFPPESFTVAEIVVVRSELAPGGSLHTPLSRHKLGGND